MRMTAAMIAAMRMTTAVRMITGIEWSADADMMHVNTYACEHTHM
jgi:hypothetical protein